MDRAQLGHRAEELAEGYLVERGYQVVERNYRCRRGEIDLVAFQGEVLCFVEVRSRTGDAFGTPLLTVNRPKQQRIVRAALDYLTRKAVRDTMVRFDVLGITFLRGDVEFELIPNAFDAGM